MLMADDAYSSGPTASALQTWTLLHLSLVLLALLLYAAHLRGAFSAAGVGGRGPSRLLTWVPPSTAGLVASCTPCASRQAQKLVCLAALAFGSPVAASHLEWSNALDLALLVAQYAVQEVGAHSHGTGPAAHCCNCSVVRMCARGGPSPASVAHPLDCRQRRW